MASPNLHIISSTTDTFAYWLNATNNLISLANKGLYTDGSGTDPNAIVVVNGSISSNNLVLKQSNTSIEFRNNANTLKSSISYNESANSIVITTANANNKIMLYSNGSLEGVKGNTSFYYISNNEFSNTLSTALSTKLDLAGGSIAGNVNITGTLNLNGVLNSNNNLISFKSTAANNNIFEFRKSDNTLSSKFMWSYANNSLNIDAYSFDGTTVTTSLKLSGNTAKAFINNNEIYHAGNFNPSDYLKFTTGGSVSGTLSVDNILYLKSNTSNVGITGKRSNNSDSIQIYHDIIGEKTIINAMNSNGAIATSQLVLDNAAASVKFNNNEIYHAGNFNPSDYILKAGSTATGAINFGPGGISSLTTTGDIVATRLGGNTGAIYFNSAKNRYLYYDGTSYSLPFANLTVGGDIQAFSDSRLKNNINTLTEALKILNQINGVSFTWNEYSHNPGKNDLGVIADEVEKVLPEIVSYSKIEEKEYKTVSYTKLIPILIESIKELNRRIEELENK